MGVAEDLKTLQELHEKGTLTETEFTAAKAATLKNEPLTNAAPRTRRKSHRAVWWLALILVSLLAFIWYSLGTRDTTQILATAVHAPIQLVNEIQNVPAHSWKAVPFTTTYAGSVTIDIREVRGNPIDVFVMNADQLDKLKANESVLTFTDFDAQKTQVYERTARLQQGTYYLVMRDTSLGILSSSASDISVRIQLNP